jgi:hypothetical protein
MDPGERALGAGVSRWPVKAPEVALPQWPQKRAAAAIGVPQEGQGSALIGTYRAYANSVRGNGHGAAECTTVFVRPEGTTDTLPFLQDRQTNPLAFIIHGRPGREARRCQSGSPG